MRGDWGVYAFDALRFLVDYVLQEKFYNITYNTLATKINKMREDGRPDARNMRIVLSVLGRTLANLSEPPQIPNIGCLVVNAQTHLPGDGVKEFWIGYPEFSRERKHEIFHNECEYIRAFGTTNWERVMGALSPQKMLDSHSYDHDTCIDYYMCRGWF